MVLSTPRLVIADHEPGDLDDLHRLLSDPLAMRYLPEVRTETLDQSRANLQTALEEQAKPDRTKFFFKICLQDGVYVGEIGYTVLGRGALGTAVDLGYFTLPEFWGRGLVTEAARAVLDQAFVRGDVHEVVTGCLAENGGSEAVMKKLGLTKAAHLSGHTLHEGIWKDRVEYRLTREGWNTTL